MSFVQSLLVLQQHSQVVQCSSCKCVPNHSGEEMIGEEGMMIKM
jgi:hypothetical protein